VAILRGSGVLRFRDKTMNQYPYRILLLYPESRVLEIEAWYASQFPERGDLLTPIGTKNGEDWFASSFVATKADVEKWLAVFGYNLQTDIPAGFVDMPRAIQEQWIAGMKQAAIATLGIYIDATWNDQAMSCDVQSALTAMGVSRFQVGDLL